LAVGYWLLAKGDVSTYGVHGERCGLRSSQQRIANSH
jgi:hypothetical protein